MFSNLCGTWCGSSQAQQQQQQQEIVNQNQIQSKTYSQVQQSQQSHRSYVTFKPTSSFMKQAPLSQTLKKAGKIVVVGYSPTGGGHTQRTFNVLHEAVTQKKFREGDVIILQLPEMWAKGDAQKGVMALIQSNVDRLMKAGIKVILSHADKSVFGFLNEDGSSDDANILEKMALFPKREDNVAEQHAVDFDSLIVDQEQLNNGAVQESFSGVEQSRISAKYLMQNIKYQLEKGQKSGQVSQQNSARSESQQQQGFMSNIFNVQQQPSPMDKVFVLTDMDPYLQKAAKVEGVPFDNIIDQQNHATLINENDPCSPQQAFLSRVINAEGKISHIDLGGCNALQEVQKTVSTLNINENTTRTDARQTVINHFMDNANPVAPLGEEGKWNGKGGILKSSSLTNPQSVKNVVYIYAHTYTETVLRHISKNLEKDGYKDTLFVVCAAGAFKEGVQPNNALHLCYLADASGITTGGAGTNGEFAYIKNQDKGSVSKLLIFPIKSHNEQEKNAQDMCQHYPKTVSSVNTRLSAKHLEQYIQEYSSKLNQLVTDPPQVQQDTMGKFFQAINNRNTYAKKTVDLWLGDRQYSKPSQIRQDHVRQMSADFSLKFNRRLVKLLFQILDHLERGETTMTIKMKQSDQPKPQTLSTIVTLMQNEESLIDLLGLRDKYDDEQNQFGQQQSSQIRSFILPKQNSQQLKSQIKPQQQQQQQQQQEQQDNSQFQSKIKQPSILMISPEEREDDIDNARKDVMGFLQDISKKGVDLKSNEMKQKIDKFKHRFGEIMTTGF